MLKVPRSAPVPDGPFHIGQVAELTGLSLRSIRHYEELGLVAPASRTKGGFRVYGTDAVERLRLVMVLRLTGLSLEDIHPVVEACRASEAGETVEHPDALANATAQVEEVLRDLEARLEPTRALLERLRAAQA